MYSSLSFLCISAYSTILQFYNSTILQFYNSTILQLLIRILPVTCGAEFEKGIVDKVIGFMTFRTYSVKTNVTHGTNTLRRSKNRYIIPVAFRARKFHF